LLSFSLLARLWHAPSFLLAPGPRPIPTLFPTGPAKVSALADWFLYLKQFPRARFTHRPDDGGSKDLWNVGKLLPDYTALQPRKQPSSFSPRWEPQILQSYNVTRVANKSDLINTVSPLHPSLLGSLKNATNEERTDTKN
jgi:hypothetical protein